MNCNARLMPAAPAPTMHTSALSVAGSDTLSASIIMIALWILSHLGFQAVHRSLTLHLDDYDTDDFVSVATDYGCESFDYVVTPNVDHVIRYCDDAEFRSVYAHAGFVLLDSRLMARMVRLTRGLRLPVCPGSDLVSALLPRVGANDVIVLIGGDAQQARQLAQLYGLRNLRHFEPPMGFIRDPAAVEATLGFIERQSPFRFC